MSDWTSGYITDVNYTFGFYRELAPTLLKFVSLLKGQYGPDLDGAISYCELGCGQGLSMNVLAAANPHIKFFANDFNPSQIVGAQALARAGGLSNVNFFDDSFEDFAKSSEIPAKFDIVALHGIYSWISPENRGFIVEFLKTKLKVGGIVYISYNTLPGWSSVMPLRRLMADTAKSLPGTLLPKVGRVLDEVDNLRKVNAKYFQIGVGLEDRFNRLKTMEPNYLVHEYFNEHWTPFYSADVASELSAAKLTFLSSATVMDHVDAVNFTVEQQKILRSASDTRQVETLKDFLLNQQFRRDVFVKGSSALSSASNREAWLTQRFILMTPRDAIDMTVKGALGEANLQENVYGPILDNLQHGAKQLKDLVANSEIGALGWGAIIQALTVLVGAGHIVPCLSAKDEAKRQKSCQAFNKAVLANARTSGELQYLASPVTGSGYQISRFSQLFLLAWTLGQKESRDLASFVWQILTSQDQKIVKDGKPLDSAEDNLKELVEQADTFLSRQLPVLKNLLIA